MINIPTTKKEKEDNHFEFKIEEEFKEVEL